MRHAVTVATLAELLKALPQTDVLVPNSVLNLAIVRDGEQVGFIDLLEGHAAIELFEPSGTGG